MSKRGFEACYSPPHYTSLAPELTVEVICGKDGRHSTPHKAEVTITGLNEHGEVTFTFRWNGVGVRYPQ